MIALYIIGALCMLALCVWLHKSSEERQRRRAAAMTDEQLEKEIVLAYGYGEAKAFMDELAERRAKGKA